MAASCEKYVPYTVLAAGIVVAAAGLGMHFGARGMYQSYDKQVSGCAVTETYHGGCQLTSGLAGAKSGADILQVAAISAYAVGGALTVIGAVLIYANRLQPYRISVGVTNAAKSMTFVPFFGPSGGGAALSGTF